MISCKERGLYKRLLVKLCNTNGQLKRQRSVEEVTCVTPMVIGKTDVYIRGKDRVLHKRYRSVVKTGFYIRGSVVKTGLYIRGSVVKTGFYIRGNYCKDRCYTKVHIRGSVVKTGFYIRRTNVTQIVMVSNVKLMVMVSSVKPMVSFKTDVYISGYTCKDRIVKTGVYISGYCCYINVVTSVTPMVICKDSGSVVKTDVDMSVLMTKINIRGDLCYIEL
ncbi:hypothetical protein DPMN_040884 [Dreissena polymorpha]|uniref:Uncharacterized protein n=1 Tax=Dreissena polymorpha TaxID=45954 RepID=A0A9D4CXJ2_DREPO|nr:hypothetical protein DPMN_040884 [Dreissena polymorpha]